MYSFFVEFCSTDQAPSVHLVNLCSVHGPVGVDLADVKERLSVEMDFSLEAMGRCTL